MAPSAIEIPWFLFSRWGPHPIFFGASPDPQILCQEIKEKKKFKVREAPRLRRGDVETWQSVELQRWPPVAKITEFLMVGGIMLRNLGSMTRPNAIDKTIPLRCT